MKPIAIALGAVVAVLLALALAAAVSAGLDAFSGPTAADIARIDAEAARYAAEQAKYERQLALQAELYWLDTTLAAAWRVLPLVAVAGGLAYAAARGAASARFRAAHVDPDSRGLLPVPNAQLGTIGAQALGAYHAARQLEAQQQPVPHSQTITYAPHHAPRLDYRHHGAEGLEPAALPAPVAAAVPSFAALLDAGRVGRGNPLLLGYSRDTGAEIVGDWKDLYSCAVGGLSGSGKSWTATYLLAQAALHGSRLLILDPHAESAESLAARLAPLSSRFVCAPATTPREMLAALELAAGELERRKAGGYVRGSAPIVIVADEFSALQRGELAEPLAHLIEGLAQEGRKLDLYGMVCGQVWTASRAGGTELRDSLASAYVHRLRPAQARVLTGYTAADLPGDLLELPPGHAYMLSTAGDLRPVIIPQMTPADVARVAQLLEGGPVAGPGGAPSPTPSTVRPVGFRPAGATGGASEGAQASPLRPHQDAAQLTPEEAAIVAAFIGGKSASDLAAELAGGKKSGDAYMVAARKVAEVLRRALGGKGAQHA